MMRATSNRGATLPSHFTPLHAPSRHATVHRPPLRYTKKEAVKLSAMLKPGLEFRLVQLADGSRIAPALKGLETAEAAPLPAAASPVPASSATGPAAASLASPLEPRDEESGEGRQRAASFEPCCIERERPVRPASAPAVVQHEPESLAPELLSRPMSVTAEAHAVKVLLLERLFNSAAGVASLAPPPVS